MGQKIGHDELIINLFSQCNPLFVSFKTLQLLDLFMKTDLRNGFFMVVETVVFKQQISLKKVKARE